jgi:hypothetical protein
LSDQQDLKQFLFRCLQIGQKPDLFENVCREQPVSGGSWSWTGPNGYTSTSRQINNIPLVNGTNTFVATYTNPGGCKSQQTFTITAQ